MFNNHHRFIRGNYFVTTARNALMFDDGLTMQISVATDKEFDLDIECDEDLAVIENLIIYFRPTKTSWKKAYHRLRCEFGHMMKHADDSARLNLRQRLLLHKRLIAQARQGKKQLKQGAAPCAK